MNLLHHCGAELEEKELRNSCRRIKKMITAKRAAPTPLPGETPRETMMKRFLAEELLRVARTRGAK